MLVAASVALPNFAYGAEPLTVMEWAGYDDAAYYKPFADKHGTPNFSLSFAARARTPKVSVA